MSKFFFTIIYASGKEMSVDVFLQKNRAQTEVCAHVLFPTPALCSIVDQLIDFSFPFQVTPDKGWRVVAVFRRVYNVVVPPIFVTLPPLAFFVRITGSTYCRHSPPPVITEG
jgi:hypothetical protein